VPASAAVTGVDTTKPGFVARTYQVATNLDNEINLAEAVLHGDVGANVADLTSFNNGVYTESGTLNYGLMAADLSGIVAVGDFNANSVPPEPDKQFPGTPSKTVTNPDGSIYNNNFAMEVLTYVQFPKQGLYKLNVNSDDGFRLQIGNGDAARDQLNSLIVCQYDGGRGASDTRQTVYIPQAGFYPVRLLYFQGGGGAGLEFSAINDNGPAGADGTFALVNDSTVTGSLNSYQARTGATPIVVGYATPGRALGQRVRAENSIYVEITDGTSSTVNSGSVSLTVNGSAVQPTVNKSSGLTTISYPVPNSVWPSGSTVTNVLTYADNSTPPVVTTDEWTFTVMSYTTVPPSLALPAAAVDTTKPGFILKMVQQGIYQFGKDLTTSNPEIGLANSTYSAETEIRGLYGWPNTANLSLFTGPDGYYVEPTQIAYNASGYSAEDGFTLNQMPGAPGTALNENGNDNFVMEILTVVNFPTVGVYTMDVNSDDGFRVIVGNRNDAFYQVLGEDSAGKGASDVNFNFAITKPGLYPLRNLYEEGGGGTEVTWTMVDNGSFAHGVGTLNNGWHSLINGTVDPNGNTDTAALKAYQYPILTTKGSPYVAWFAPAPAGTSYTGAVPGSHVKESPITGMRPGPDTAIQAILVDGETAIDTSTIKLTLDGVSVTPTVTKNGTNTTVYYKPTAPLSNASTNNIHSVSLTFLDRTLNWNFQVGTIPTPVFDIEASDFNHDSGQTQAAASQMPYIGGA
ncbi:MAG: hypothetical protein KGS61_20475, partial [Verrucomicrobia bacterium]|nr:hypothetical protein [Verrucomicrobiota bacterium]